MVSSSASANNTLLAPFALSSLRCDRADLLNNLRPWVYLIDDRKEAGDLSLVTRNNFQVLNKVFSLRRAQQSQLVHVIPVAEIGHL